jgi:hypothetical protein
MKNLKEKQFLVNMALSLGQVPDPALVKEIKEHKELMDSITPRGDEFGELLAQLAQLKNEVETVKQVVEVKQQYFKPTDYPKPPTLDELMAVVTEVVFEPIVEKQVEEIPIKVEVKEKLSPLIAAASEHITKEVQMEAVSFQQPEIDPMSRTLDDLRNKIKQLENWISKIASTGPGSGEVNLLRLDDVDTSNIGNNKFLRYNAANAKIEFATVTGGTGGAVDSVNGQTGEVVLSTTDVGEGSNLYFTNSRAQVLITPAFDKANTAFLAATAAFNTANIGGGGGANLLAVSSAIVPDADSVYNLGTANLRWGTLFLANNTINLGGSLISSDGTGTITISSSGAVLPVNSKVAVDGIDKNIALVGNTGAIATVVPFYTKQLGLNTVATNFTFGANPDDFVFTNFTFSNGSAITQSARALFYF